jgi:hypothetical protein
MVMTVLCGGIGLVYGMMSSAGVFGAVLAGTGYGLLGLLIGVPAGFVIIATRHLFP